MIGVNGLGHQGLLMFQFEVLVADRLLYHGFLFFGQEHQRLLALSEAILDVLLLTRLHVEGLKAIPHIFYSTLGFKHKPLEFFQTDYSSLSTSSKGRAFSK